MLKYGPCVRAAGFPTIKQRAFILMFRERENSSSAIVSASNAEVIRSFPMIVLAGTERKRDNPTKYDGQNETAYRWTSDAEDLSQHPFGFRLRSPAEVLF